MTTMKVLVFVVIASVGVLNAQLQLNSDMALAMLLGNQNGGGGGGSNLLHNLVMMKTLGDAGPALMLALQNQRRFRGAAPGLANEALPKRGDARPAGSNVLRGLAGLGGSGGISPLLLALSTGDAMKKIAPLLLLQQNRALI